MIRLVSPAILLLVVSCGKGNAGSWQAIYQMPQVQKAISDADAVARRGGYRTCMFSINTGGDPPKVHGTWTIRNAKIAFSNTPGRSPGTRFDAFDITLVQNGGSVTQTNSGGGQQLGSGEGYVSGEKSFTYDFGGSIGKKTFQSASFELWFHNHASHDNCEQEVVDIVNFFHYVNPGMFTPGWTEPPTYDVCGFTVVFNSTCGGEGWSDWQWGSTPIHPR